MPHLADGALRLVVDGFPDLPASDKKHLLACTSCRRRADSIRERVARIGSIFAGGRGDSYLTPAGSPSRGMPWLQAAAAAIVLCIAAISYAPLRSLATGVAAAVRDQIVRPIAITKEEARALQDAALPAARDVAEYSPARARYVGYLDKKDAELAAGRQILTPRYVPAELAKGYVIYHVRAAQHYRLVIAALHATLTRVLPPVVEQTYGERQAYENHRGFSASGVGILGIPQGYVDIIQRPVAPVAIEGATPEQVRAYLRRRASAIPSVAAAMREGVDPLDHMMLLRDDVQQIRPVDILGARGYVVENTRGLGNALVWQKSSVMYLVEGSFTVDELLEIARSLHA